jgi:hypothetical protein
MEWSALELLAKAPSKKAVEDFLLACFRFRNSPFPPGHVSSLVEAFQSNENDVGQVFMILNISN